MRCAVAQSSRAAGASIARKRRWRHPRRRIGIEKGIAFVGWRPSLAAIALLAAPAPLLPQDDVARIGSEACPAEPEAFVMPTTGAAFTLPPDPDQAACAEPAPPPPPIRPPAPSLFRMVALPVGDTAPRQKWELARLGEVAEETARAMRQLRRTVNAVDDNPHSLIFGNGPPTPGPGEPGFTAPGGKP